LGILSCQPGAGDMTIGGTTTASPQSCTGCSTGRSAYDGLLKVDEGDRVQRLWRLRDVDPPAPKTASRNRILWSWSANLSMQPAELLETLGYAHSANCLQGRELNHAPGFGHVFRRAQETAGLEAVYCLRTPPSGLPEAYTRGVIPVVYVCRAPTLDAADQIHRLVWNQNIAPFVVVLTPTGVRLYSGFDLARTARHRSSGVGRLVDADLDTAASALESISARSIDDGTVWDRWGRLLRPQNRVQWRLLTDLRKLEEQLVADGLKDQSLIHALIGKYVYLHYLRDRDILSDRRLAEWKLSWKEVTGRGASPKAFARLCRQLDEWLNGSVFPLATAEFRRIGDDAVRRVASVFAGDSPHGQMQLDFSAYDFAHIPIETLSIIYEQFLHAARDDEGQSEGWKQAAYYTPIPVVNFLLDRMEELHPLRSHMRVLDPSCGSGAFLVQCYRKRIEDLLRDRGSKEPLKPTELRQCLQEQIFGIDVDVDACRVAELSLILTLLDYVNPPDLTTTTFKLPSLANKNIVQANAFDNSNQFVAKARRERFDWIVGNPPWKDLTERDSQSLIHGPVLDWIAEHKDDKPTGGNQAAEAFAWRVSEFAKESALVGLLVPSMTLFKSESTKFRRAFFGSVRLAYVANFANLTEVLFAGRSRVPAAAILFWPSSDSKDERFPVFSPFVANQEATRPRMDGSRAPTWTLTINENEVRVLAMPSVRTGEATVWKVATWGSPIDERLLKKVAGLPHLGLLEKIGAIRMGEGVRLQTVHDTIPEGVRAEPGLVGKRTLLMSEMERVRRTFAFGRQQLRRIETTEAFNVIRSGVVGLAVSEPPHVLVSAARHWAVYSDEYILVPPRQIGIAGAEAKSALLRAIAVYLNSDFVTYQQFFTSPELGVKRPRSTLTALRHVPIPRLLAEQDADLLVSWSQLYDLLAELDRSTPRALDADEMERKRSQLLQRLDREVYTALGLSGTEQARVSDLVNIQMSLMDGQIGEAAVRNPRKLELLAYGDTLRCALDDFLGTTDRKHHVCIWSDQRQGMIGITLSDGTGSTEVATLDQSKRMIARVSRVRNALAGSLCQWRYFNRNLRLFSDGRVYLFKPMQRLHWMKSQAVLDATEVIAQVLDQRETV
jgi:hypothetical protein